LPATPEELAALEAVGDEIALDGVANVTVDGQSVSAINLRELKEWLQWRTAQAAVTGTNANGGSRSYWNQLRPARFSPAGPGQ
jgi:hypothetical protein